MSPTTSHHPSYLLLDLETLSLSNRDGISPRASVQHPLLDRRPARASVHEDHDVRAGIVVEGVPGRGGGDVGGDSTRLDARLAVSKNDLLGGNVNSLPNGKSALFESYQAIIPHFRIHDHSESTGHNAPCKVV
jgi:hypothetical protein